MNFNKISILCVLIFSYVTGCLGYLDIVVGIGSALYQNSICRLTVCCNEREIPGDFEKLRTSLRTKLFGQPLVESTVMNALKAHWNDNHEPDKALTISFHGGPGIGKNYVVQFIEESLYEGGRKSPHVHNFNSRLHFPEVAKVDQYKRDLAKWIEGNVTNCPKQLFVFDEVNLMPPGILDVLKPYIDHIKYVNRINFRRSIFIFLSNTGATVINDLSYKLWDKGIDREKTTLDVYEKLISHGAFNEKGGFQHSANIKNDLIDHYVPFLPLMKRHVVLCIRQEFMKLAVDPSEDQIQAVLDFIDWGPTSDQQVFAKTGCKRISQKVRLVTY